MNSSLTIQNLYDLSGTFAAELFEGKTYPFEVLPHIGSFIKEKGEDLVAAGYEDKGGHVYIHPTAKIAPTAVINGPVVIGENTEVRPGAFIRGNAFVGNDVVVGNSTELKNCILFDRVQVPHYNYVGDAVLGVKAHMGAGAITANVKADNSNVTIRGIQGDLPTGLRKVGAFLGDYADVGCNSVLTPGTVIGRHTNVYPLSMVRGEVPAGCIYKGKGNIVKKK
jgi:NDP-sugar pyrophosphorylase family protein